MHTTTIQGQSWRPCAACPRARDNGGDGTEGVCPSRRHPPYCEHARTDWPRWRDVIRREPVEDRPGREIPPEPEPVGLLQRAVNFAHAVVEHAASGWREAPAELVEARLATCRGCDQYRASDATCGGMTGCGCFVEIKAKWLEQRCPLDRWPTSPASG